jgi:hypothetical protein
MPQTLQQSSWNAPEPLRVKWTREDCARFVDLGYLTQEGYELIEGDILRKMGQKRPHSIAVMRLIAWCISVFGADFVQTQASINVAPEDNPTSEPEPDVFVLNRSVAFFPEAFPGPDALVLAVEVSDTTLAFDLSTKAALYARAAIVEYWVLDVTGRALIVHRDPQNGRYQSVIRYVAEEIVACAAAPQYPVAVATLLPLMTSTPSPA